MPRTISRPDLTSAQPHRALVRGRGPEYRIEFDACVEQSLNGEPATIEGEIAIGHPIGTDG